MKFTYNVTEEQVQKAMEHRLNFAISEIMFDNKTMSRIVARASVMIANAVEKRLETISKDLEFIQELDTEIKKTKSAHLIAQIHSLMAELEKERKTRGASGENIKEALSEGEA
jgi:galactitol-specific phosphotransferase system IIB component